MIASKEFIHIIYGRIMGDSVATLGLQFGKLYTMVLIVLVCTLFSATRRAFLRAGMIALFGMMFNVYLKSIWQLPLPPELNSDSWAFPSGHFQATIVFYGWLLREFSNVRMLIIFCAIAFIEAICLMYFGFHNSVDIVGAFIAGLITILLFELLLKSFPKRGEGYLPMLFLTLSIIFIAVVNKEMVVYYYVMPLMTMYAPFYMFVRSGKYQRMVKGWLERMSKAI